MANQQVDAVTPAVAGTVGHHWVLYLIEGFILVLLGLLAAFVSPLFQTILFGWLFLVGGIVGLITTFMSRQAPGFWWSLLSGILAAGVGSMILAQPMLGMAALTFLLFAFFVLEGIVTIMFALDHRRDLSRRWAWMLMSGIVDLLVASVILMGWPATSAWAMGLIVGINLMFGGASMIGMALAARP